MRRRFPVMQTEYIYPAPCDRTSPKEWVEIGKPDLVKRAIETKRKILDAPRRQIIDLVADMEIRQKFQDPPCRLDWQARFKPLEGPDDDGREHQ